VSDRGAGGLARRCLAVAASVPDTDPLDVVAAAVAEVVAARCEAPWVVVASTSGDARADAPADAEVVAATGELAAVAAGAGVTEGGGPQPDATGSVVRIDRLEVVDRASVVTRTGPFVRVRVRDTCAVLGVDLAEAGAPEDELVAAVGTLDLELRRRRSVRAASDRGRELADTAARLSSLIDANALAIVALDPDGHVTLWNRGAEALLGWSADTIMGTRLLELMPEDHSDLDLEGMRATLEGAGAVGSFELQLRHRDGRYRELEGTLSPILDERGAVTGSSVIYRDVEARNEALRRLAANEELFRLLADSSQDVVYRIAFEPRPHVEYISPAATDRLGFTPDELTADPGLLGDRVHPDDRHLLLDVAGLDVAALDDVPARLRFRFQHADGRWRWVEDRRDPIVDARGQLIGVSGVLRDVAAEVEAEQRLRRALDHERAAAAQLRRSDEVRTRFLSAVSHELRTPLTAILGFAETTERTLGDGDERALTFVRRIRANAERLQLLIGDLLDVGRLTGGSDDPQRERVDLVALLRETVHGVDLGDRELEVDVPATCEADLDGVLVRRAVENLLRNAARHTPRGTHVALRLVSARSHVSVTVEDDGPGVPEEARDRVLRPFEQGERAAADPSPGTGIGLALVDRAVRVQGGRVQVGERPGGGARFVLVIPRWRPPGSGGRS
jgi:PAS domain S-box-containing protein